MGNSYQGLLVLFAILWISASYAFSIKTPDICYRSNTLQYPTSAADQILIEARNYVSKGTLPIEDPASDPALMNKTITLAVCTTAINPGPVLQAWLEYHLRRFNLILVFIDDPSERPLFETLVREKLHNDPRIQLHDGYPDRSDMSPSGVMNRQNVNTQTAVDIALANNITWLLHIDSDELFYEDGDRSWESLEGVDHISFMNHEVVPVTHKVTNPFAECTLFKVNSRLPFIAYGNGKSAVRLAPGVQAWGVHAFTNYTGEHREVEKPMILHYPNPSFESWVQKYKSYGKFSNFWFEDPTRINPLTFMLESRDKLQQALESGNWEEAREFFNSMIPDQEACERMLESGDMRRYTPLDE